MKSSPIWKKKSHKKMDEKAELERQYEEKMERWVYLNELAEKINAQ